MVAVVKHHCCPYQLYFQCVRQKAEKIITLSASGASVPIASLKRRRIKTRDVQDAEKKCYAAAQNSLEVTGSVEAARYNKKT